MRPFAAHEIIRHKIFTKSICFQYYQNYVPMLTEEQMAEFDAEDLASVKALQAQGLCRGKAFLPPYKLSGPLHPEFIALQPERCVRSRHNT